MKIALLILGGGMLGLAGLARLFCLARWRAGWAMYLANVFWEVFPKKLGLSRFWLEAASAALGLVLLAMGGCPRSMVVVLGLALMALEYANRRWERRLLTGPVPDRIFLTVEAPFVRRRPRYNLGLLWTGIPFDVELWVGNPGPTTRQVQLHLDAPEDWLAESCGKYAQLTIAPASVAKVTWTLCPAPAGPGILEITATADGQEKHHIQMGYDGCRSAAESRPIRAAISRYPGGRRSAFAWRGDMDLYDVLTRQSIEGLTVTLGLAARYSFPQTMCLSTRLSFDEQEARAWAAHEGREHGAGEIPAFISWLREKVDLRHACTYPARGNGKPYVMELGNHGHLHYDTATSAAAENGWKSHARMGAGRYPWMTADRSSFGEQRDNILEATRWCQRLLGFVPRSWAKPGRCNAADTARAAAAAGCEVLSGSDIRARDNVIYQPPPHHPGGTTAVELTSRYPPDPQHIHHFAMLRFWLHRAWRLGRPLVFMCHQHMRQWEGLACARFTEHVLRCVLADFQGDLYIDTLYGVGKYWREILSPATRRVRVALTDQRLRIENQSDMDFMKIPVDVERENGARSTVLVSVRSGETAEVDLHRD